jgi:GTP-binding protein Era
MESQMRAGLVAFVGRPNVGKSTLMNRIIGEKVSITSRRPQTTRHRVVGIKNRADGQLVLVDTPGMHGGESRLLGRYMKRAIVGALHGVDCVAMVITAEGWREMDEPVLEAVRAQPVPVILVINKIDRLPTPEALLPLIDSSGKKMSFAEIVPVSAARGTNVNELEDVLMKYLPEQPPIYPQDQLTDRSERFLAAERIREQVFRAVGDEIPYATAVEIERFRRDNKKLNIDALIYVEKPGQKAVLIGKEGERIKAISSAARLEMEKLFGEKVFLRVWVKLREGWADSERALHGLGYIDEDR